MISRNVDIWAVLILLLAFALFTRTSETATRLIRARVSIYQTLNPIDVHVSPFRLNQFHQHQKPHHITSGRLI